MIRALLIALVLPVVAVADDRSDAAALFDEGIKAMKAGNYEQACAALEKSNALYADSGTRGSLARCYEKLGRVASSWKLWIELSKTAPEKLRPDAAANAAKLEPRLPKYVLHVTGATQLQAIVDGVVVDARPGVPAPIDPGEHVLRIEAAGFGPWQRTFQAVEGKTERFDVDLRPVATVDPHPDPDPGKPIEEPAPKSSRRKIGFALIGVGGAFVIGGGVFGVIAKNRNDDAKDICGGDIDACNPARLADAQDKVDSARTAGNISTIGFVAGGAALVTGVILLVTAPKGNTQIAVTPADGVSVIVTRRF